MKFIILEKSINDDYIKNSLEIKWFNMLNPIFFGKKPSLNERWELSESTRRKISDSLKSNFKYIIKKCLYCNKEMNITSSSKIKFCSRDCTNKYRIRIYKPVDSYEMMKKLYTDENKTYREIAKIYKTNRMKVSRSIHFYGLNKT